MTATGESSGANSNHGSRFDVTGLGEVMMRLSVGPGERLLSAAGFAAHLGGAESNVCAALAGLGRRTAWFGALPENPLGAWALRTLRSHGVVTDGVRLVPGARLGTYFVELGSAPNPIDVTYDRADSAAASMTPADVDWELLLDTYWLHLTGITPALGPGPAAIVDQALSLAGERKVKVSFDVNFRAKLWRPEEARAFIEPRLELIDLVICGAQDAATVFQLDSEPLTVARELAARSRSGSAVVTVGSRGAVAVHQGQELEVPGLPSTVIDRLGAGDAFVAGLLDGLLDDQTAAGWSQALRRGVTVGAMALGQHGDIVQVDRSTLARTLAGNALRPER